MHSVLFKTCKWDHSVHVCVCVQGGDEKWHDSRHYCTKPTNIMRVKQRSTQHNQEETKETLQVWYGNIESRASEHRLHESERLTNGVASDQKMSWQCSTLGRQCAGTQKKATINARRYISVHLVVTPISSKKKRKCCCWKTEIIQETKVSWALRSTPPPPSQDFSLPVPLKRKTPSKTDGVTISESEHLVQWSTVPN